MAAFDSASLLDLFNRYTGRPTAADEVTDVQKYSYLTEAQARVVADVAGRAPNVLTSGPTLMTTSDNKVFTFGTDSDGYPVFPMGNARIFASLSSVPDYPLQEGIDFLQEGRQVRIPNDRTYSGSLYWRGVTSPADISASSEPSLFPEASRNLIAIEAARVFVQTQDRPDRAAELGAEYARELARWLLVWKRQFSNGGALRSITGLRVAMR